MARWMMFLLAGLSLSLAACDDKDTGDSEEADTDTDADTDSDTDVDCVMNSAWPCTCDINGSTCDDGSDCIFVGGVGGKTLGLCAASCMGKGASCPATDFTGNPYCGVYDDPKKPTEWWCLLACTTVEDCPSDQDCISLGTGSICYPPGS